MFDIERFIEAQDYCNSYETALEEVKRRRIMNTIDEYTKSMLFWKLGPGDANRLLNGESPVQQTDRIASARDINAESIPEDAMKVVPMNDPVHPREMEVLSKGHIPQAQEDHWFMYVENGVMRWYRSWTGIRVFEASIASTGSEYVIDSLKVTVGIPDVPFTGPRSAVALFRMLVSSQFGKDFYPYWDEYIDALEKGE